MSAGVKRKITTGDLRQLLYISIEKVIDGSLDPNRANAIAKLATAINNSVWSEAEAIKNILVLELERPTPEIGDLDIGPKIELIGASDEL